MKWIKVAEQDSDFEVNHDLDMLYYRLSESLEELYQYGDNLQDIIKNAIQPIKNSVVRKNVEDAITKSIESNDPDYIFSVSDDVYELLSDESKKLYENNFDYWLKWIFGEEL